eukprot:gene14848-biopygen3200
MHLVRFKHVAPEAGAHMAAQREIDQLRSEGATSDSDPATRFGPTTVQLGPVMVGLGPSLARLGPSLIRLGPSWTRVRHYSILPRRGRREAYRSERREGVHEGVVHRRVRRHHRVGQRRACEHIVGRRVRSHQVWPDPVRSDSDLGGSESDFGSEGPSRPVQAP